MPIYAMEATKEITKVDPMSVRMKQIAALIEAIELMKDKMVLVKFNDQIPYAIKTTKMADMQRALEATERRCIALMQEEIESYTDAPGDGHGDGRGRQ